jgi:hypothetical protein
MGDEMGDGREREGDEREMREMRETERQTERETERHRDTDTKTHRDDDRWLLTTPSPSVLGLPLPATPPRLTIALLSLLLRSGPFVEWATQLEISGSNFISVARRRTAGAEPGTRTTALPPVSRLTAAVHWSLPPNPTAWQPPRQPASLALSAADNNNLLLSAIVLLPSLPFLTTTTISRSRHSFILQRVQRLIPLLTSLSFY